MALVSSNDRAKRKMALIAYVLFLLIVVIGKLILQYYKTGDCGLRPITARSPIISIIPSVLLILSFVTTFSLATMEVFGKFESQVRLNALGTILGILFCAIGITIASISQHQMESSWRIGVDESEKTKLVTHGLYSYVRNPIYCGVILFGMGLLILIPHTLMLVGLFLGYLSIELQVRYVEEPYLLRLHGETYERYSRKVKRYFPNVFHKTKKL